MRWSIAILMSLVGLNSFAQSYFNRVYDLGAVDISGQFVQNHKNEVFYCSPSQTATSVALLIHQIEENGDLNFMDSVDIPGVIIIPGYPNATAYNPYDSTMLVIGGYDTDWDTTDAEVFSYVAVLDSMGKIIHQKVFGDFIFHDLEGVIIQDSMYHIVGKGSKGKDDFSSIYYVQLDFDINVLFDTILIRDASCALECHAIIPMENKGFIFGGNKLCIGSNKHYLIQVDSNLNVVWEQTYPNSVGTADASLLSDGSILVSGYGEKFSTPERNAQFRKIDPTTGNTIWEQNFELFGNLDRVQELASGNLILGGFVEDSVGDRTPAIIKLNSEGEQIWLKTYTYEEVYKPYFLLDFDRIGENELMMTGQVNIPGKDQDVWIMKVDTNGCFNPECLPLGTGFPEVNTIEFVQPYPIPSFGTLTLPSEWRDASSIELFDVKGRKIAFEANNLTLSTPYKGVAFLRIEKQNHVHTYKVLFND